MVYDCFNNPLPVDCGNPDLNTPPMYIDDIYIPKRDPNIPLIHFQLSFMLTLVNLLVICINLLKPHTLFS